MANKSEIRDTKKVNLSSMYMIKALGGDLDAAIAQAQASMDKEDVQAVIDELQKWELRRKESN
ncbi:MAG: hypothetical protein FWF76_05715 [Oscillospiraceae bacterium]|nr:hypothetical protein [Oscillospiraceae bacterium]